MNKKLIAIIVAAVCIVPAAVIGLTWTEKYEPPLEIGTMYDDCYLDIVGADSIMLKFAPSTSNILGMNIEDAYDGDTLYKTVGGQVYPVEMYSLTDDGERENQEIDRKVKEICELDDDAFLITYYGKPSTASSSGLLRAGYTYDPNSQLTYIVDADTGAMYNITQYTREIVRTANAEDYPDGKTNEDVTPNNNCVSDLRYTLNFVGVEDGKYKFNQNHQTGYVINGSKINFTWEWRYIYFEITADGLATTFA